MATRLGTWTTVAAVVALVLGAAAVGMLLARPQQVAAAADIGGMRQITVVGSGDVRAAPDTARVQVGVQTQAATAQEALQQNNAQMTALVARLKEAGIADADLQTSNVSVWPRSPDGMEVQGYQADNNVTVTIRNVAQTGDLLDKIVGAGANNIGGISFTVNDPTALQTEARNKALADARTRAEAMAQAIGGTVGQVLSVTENIGQASPMFARAQSFGAASAADAANVPVQAGEQTITAQVQVTFELR